MTNILWITNKHLLESNNVSGSWLNSSLEELINNPKYRIYVLSFTTKKQLCGTFTYKSSIHIVFFISKIEYFFNFFSKKTRDSIYKKINLIKPDLIHIWGTEYFHSWEIYKIFHKKYKVIVEIQGIIAKIVPVYKRKIFSFFGGYVLQFVLFFHKSQLFNFFRMYFVSILENKILSHAKYIIGRTDFDLAHIKKINTNALYKGIDHPVRKEFYSINDYTKNNYIFFGLFQNPLKGFQEFLQLTHVFLYNNDVKVILIGKNPFGSKKIDLFNLFDPYLNHIRTLILKYKIKDRFIYFDSLTAIEMSTFMAKSKIFFISSLIENSPNVIYESILLNLYIIASSVGGIPYMLKNYSKSYIYKLEYVSDFSNILTEYFNTKDDIFKHTIRKDNNDYSEKILSFYEEVKSFNE